ncbi:endonuclease/exonuclease/phosphatase family protein [bacterium]|nr:endonuclease/exonuclease/phosphatase family protein [bacterium]
MNAPRVEPPAKGAFRIAVFNIQELDTEILTNVDEDGVGIDPRGVTSARIVQRVRPDVLAILEIDHDYRTPGAALDLNARRYIENYLMHGDHPIDYPYTYAAPSNTGIVSGQDLNMDGKIATAEDEGSRIYGGDAFGFGNYPGQYSMVLLSQYPIDAENARTMQKFLWKDLPGNHLIDELFTPEGLEVARLSSKSHWDVPVLLNGTTVHVLISHPTPQGFDGPEDRNGRRNFDEIKLWADYLNNDSAIYDDNGRHGGLAEGEHFVLLADMNADPRWGSIYENMHSIEQLLDHPRVFDPIEFQVSNGALRGRPAGPPSNLEWNTHGYRDGSRLDYALPSRTLNVTGAGVFWPAADEDLIGCTFAEHASDHRLVWVDVME